MIGAFYVTKLAGAEEDGVKVGKNLCYRCKNGGRPQVMVFTRSSDKAVVDLIKQLDAAIPKNEEKQLRAFVNYLGDEKASAKADAEKLAKTSEATNVPFVLPNEFENGPEDYGINPKAEVTIILAKGGKVEANFAASSAKDLKVDEVIADLNKILD
ncbi:hypothetical protein DTL42_15715 [Bremerella cremea]|uniref:Uncharacterized protein n=2 Tax=Bremerella cremea TaxID=1031537 RepID=A0A368KPC9_9BACT|nr:hypothetical protein DTL42_15715 [Bremerella cremea]